MALREDLWPRATLPDGASEVSPEGVFGRLVFGVVGNSPELISKVQPQIIGGGSRGAGQDGRNWTSGSNSADGVYFALPATHPLYTIGVEFTIFQVAEIASWGAYSSLLCVPYRVTSWADPFGAFGFQRENANNTVRVWGSYGGTGAQFSNTTTLTVKAGAGNRYVMAAARYTGGCRFLINGAYNDSVAGSNTSSAVDWTNKQPLSILNRSDSNNGEGTTGSASITLIFKGALSQAELYWLAENYRDVCGQQSIWAPVSAGGGSSLDLTQTTGVALAATVSASGDIQIGTNFNLTQSSAVGLTGSLATTGNIQIGTTFNLAQTANVGLAGAVGVSGDIQILSGSLDLTQTAAVAMSGTVGLSGDIQIGTSFNLAQTAAVGLTGVVGTTGNIQIGTSFNLAQSVALAMAGSVAVSGDLQSGTAPVITQSFGNFGWDPRKRLSWKRKELREELEAALDDAPKAVQELVRVPGPDVSEVGVRGALDTIREALRQKRDGSVHVVRQEIDELHEALETVATFTREREAARQARRRKQQAFLLLS